MIDLKDYNKRLPKEKIEELQTLLANAPDSLKEDAKFVRIEKGTTFIDAGEEATRIYILVKGQVKAADYRVNEVVLSGQERLMYLLTQIYHEHEQEGECIVQITQEELANHSGINLRTATRAIHQLCNENKLTKKNRKLHINKIQCEQMEKELKVIVDGGYNNGREEENNFRL